MTQCIIAGTVNADGGKERGEEFSVSRTSCGHYVIAFRPAFRQLSGISVTQIYSNDGNTRDNAVIIKATDTEVFLKTGDSNGDAADRAFSFIAVGEDRMNAMPGQ